MKELSLHILDLVQNSITAGAANINLSITESEAPLALQIKIEDNGCGMDADFVKRVTDPFTTSRKTRNVGLGIPLCKMAAEMTGGSFSIQSQPGKGTILQVVFIKEHIDCPPLGDVADTMATLIQGAPDVDYCLCCQTEQNRFDFSTESIRQILGDVPLNELEVLQWIRGNISEGMYGLFK